MQFYDMTIHSEATNEGDFAVEMFNIPISTGISASRNIGECVNMNESIEYGSLEERWTKHEAHNPAYSSEAFER